MENHFSESLFNMSIDNTARGHFVEIAKWARFVSIAGFIILAMMTLGILSFNILSSDIFEEIEPSKTGNMFFGISIGWVLVYVAISLLWFFPFFFLLRFSNRLKDALSSNDQQVLNNALLNLKSFFKYVGIVALFALLFYVLTFVFTLIGAVIFA